MHWARFMGYAINIHNDVSKWKHFLRYWPSVRGIHRSPVNSPQWRGVLKFSLICAWINGWVNNPETSDLRRHRAHYDVTVMTKGIIKKYMQWKLFGQIFKRHRANGGSSIIWSNLSKQPKWHSKLIPKLFLCEFNIWSVWFFGHCCLYAILHILRSIFLF